MSDRMHTGNELVMNINRAIVFMDTRLEMVFSEELVNARRKLVEAQMWVEKALEAEANRE